MPRRSTIAILITIAACLSSLAPAVCLADKDPANSIASGSFSVQFLTFGGGYQQPFSNSGIFMKVHMSDRSALRAGTTFSLDEESATNPLSAASRLKASDRNYSFMVSSEYEYFADETGPVTFFVGFGPYWSRTRSMYERTYIDSDTPNAPFDYARLESKNWEVGGAATFGLEWFLKRKVSVLARVGASVGFGKRHQDELDEYYDGSQLHEARSHFDSTTSRAGTSTAALGLSVYL